MAQRELWPGGTPGDLIDDLGHAIAERYRAIEEALLANLTRLYEQHLEAPDDLVQRYRAIQELREQAQNLVNTVPPEALAKLVTEEAATNASAEISRMLLDFPGYAARGARQVTRLNQGGGLAVAAVELDLRDNLRALNQRILRLPADAYQRMTSKHIGSLLTGVTTNQALHRRILDEYLADGITGFTDRSGRRWTIGAYSEMATRTAAARAWGDQARYSMQAHGINTFTPVIGNSACPNCGQWQGKILTESGATGDVTVKHAITGEPTIIHVDATMSEWRASKAGHPNCRCVMVPGLPGGPDPTKYSTWDEQKQQDRDKLRSLERDVREAKRNGTADEIGEAQAALREHVKKTGITRREYREQLPFADGGEKNPRGNLKRNRTGTVNVPDGVAVDPHELTTAHTLAQNGHHVEFRPLSNVPGVKNPDVTMDGKIWEFKAPLGSGKNTINHQFARARRQSSRLVIDLRRSGLNDALAIDQARRRLAAEKKILSVIVISKDGTLTYLER